MTRNPRDDQTFLPLRFFAAGFFAGAFFAPCLPCATSSSASNLSFAAGRTPICARVRFMGSRIRHGAHDGMEETGFAAKGSICPTCWRRTNGRRATPNNFP